MDRWERGREVWREGGREGGRDGQRVEREVWKRGLAVGSEIIILCPEMFLGLAQIGQRSDGLSHRQQVSTGVAGH